MLRQSSSSETQKTGFPQPFLKKPLKLSGLLWAFHLFPRYSKENRLMAPTGRPHIQCWGSSRIWAVPRKSYSWTGEAGWLFEIGQSQMPLI